MGRKSRTKRQRTIPKAQPASITLKVVSYVCLVIGISSFWGIAQFHHLDNIIGGVGFFFLYAFVGLLFSVPFYILIYRTVPDLKIGRKAGNQWTSNLFGLGMGFFFLTPAIASYINRTHLVSQGNCNNYKIIRNGSSGSRYREYYFFVFLNGNEERLTVFKPYWETLKKGQDIQLCLEKGILGFEYMKLQN
jgi:hypothetical protein